MVSFGPEFRSLLRVVALGGSGASVPGRSEGYEARLFGGPSEGSSGVELTTTIGGAGEALSVGARRSGVTGFVEAGELFFGSEEEEEDAAGLDPERLDRLATAGVAAGALSATDGAAGLELFGGGGGGAVCLSVD
jgi:hypothetical protein